MVASQARGHRASQLHAARMNSLGDTDNEKIEIQIATGAIDPPVDNEFLLSYRPINPVKGIVVRAESRLAQADDHVRTGPVIASLAKDLQAARRPGYPPRREIDFSMSLRLI